MQKTIIKVLKKIEDSGYKAYVVGGYPRDIILKRNSIDIDICTNATPKDLKEIFPNINIAKEKYGSTTLYFNKIHFEITTFRKEKKYINNRVPVKVEYINDLLDDLKRRDFIINTLCMDSNGNIIDYLEAKKDLEDKVIRMVGNTKNRLKEDVLRILRAVRFATILNFKLEDELENYIVKYGYLLKNLSYDRKKQELDKIFASSNVKYGLELIKDLGLDKHLEFQNFDNIKITSTIDGIWSQLGVENIYKFSKNELKSIQLINELRTKDIFDDFNVYKYGLYISSVVAEIKGIDKKEIIHKHNNLPIENISELNITVNEICEILNREPNGFIKDILSDIELKIIKREIKNDKSELKKYILNNYQ